MTLEDRIFDDPELRRCPLVRLCGQDSLRVALSQVTGRRHPDGGRVFVEGEDGDSLFLLLKGEARLITTVSGAGIQVGTARKGDVVGEGEALGRAAGRSCTVQAVGELEVLEFPAAQVRRFAPVGTPLHDWLVSLATAREAARAEATDFFNRW